MRCSVPHVRAAAFSRRCRCSSLWLLLLWPACCLLVGLAGSGKTRMLAATVASWTAQGISVFGAAPSAAAAGELREVAGLASDALQKLVYEHSRQQHNSQNRPGATWDPPAESVVLIDEAGTFAPDCCTSTPGSPKRRTGERCSLATIANSARSTPGDCSPNSSPIPTARRRTRHPAPLRARLGSRCLTRVRDGDSRPVDTYDRHGRIHGHTDQVAAIDALADEADGWMVGGAGGNRTLTRQCSPSLVTALHPRSGPVFE